MNDVFERSRLFLRMRDIPHFLSAPVPSSLRIHETPDEASGVHRAGWVSRPPRCASRAAPGERPCAMLTYSCAGVFCEPRNTAGGTPTLPETRRPGFRPVIFPRSPGQDPRRDPTAL